MQSSVISFLFCTFGLLYATRSVARSSNRTTEYKMPLVQTSPSFAQSTDIGHGACCFPEPFGGRPFNYPRSLFSSYNILLRNLFYKYRRTEELGEAKSREAVNICFILHFKQNIVKHVGTCVRTSTFIPVLYMT